MGYGEKIASGVYVVGGPGISHADDAAVYVIAAADELVMVDTGAGRSEHIIVKNMEDLGLDPTKLHWVILTHCHIDHVGGAAFFRDQYGASIAIHELDSSPLERADGTRTAASWYGRKLSPLKADLKFRGEQAELATGNEILHILHTPGHTPGSIVCYLDRDGQRILFGQDIHGPFMSAFGSDVKAWRRSMNQLLSLKIDILCEGHFGIFQPRERAEAYIRKHLAMN